MKPSIYNSSNWGYTSPNGFGSVYDNLKPTDNDE